ncbi:MAG: hypothetical protein RL477_1384, partial [Pseudomonadota bacterium]
CLALGKTDYRTDVPLLMQLGAADDWTPARHCHRLEKKIRDNGGTVEVDTYDGAHHAFDNPTGKVRERTTSNAGSTRTVHVGRNPIAAERSIARVMDWFGKRLKR